MADKPLITKRELESRLSRVVVQRLYDDNNDGEPDLDPVNQLLRDASSKVRGALGTIYDVALMDPDAAPELARIALDIAQAYAAQRHPEYVRVDGFRMMEQAERDLKRIRDGLANLGTKGPPEPAANQGGVVTVDPFLPEDESPHFALDGTGDF